jgi:hypothetical protein
MLVVIQAILIKIGIGSGAQTHKGAELHNISDKTCLLLSRDRNAVKMLTGINRYRNTES